jgi:hypothetical protein
LDGLADWDGSDEMLGEALGEAVGSLYANFGAANADAKTRK